MNKNLIISQCKSDPTTFFYYSERDCLKKLGIYYIDDLDHNSVDLQGNYQIKTKLTFFPAKNEILKSIISDEVPHNCSFQYFPTFCWSNCSVLGALTTGSSSSISLLNVKVNKFVIKDRISAPNYLYSSLDLSSNGSSNLLASSNVFLNALHSFPEGNISIYDITTKQKILHLEKDLNPDTKSANLGFPCVVRWINSDLLASSWKLYDCSNRMQIYDIREKNSLAFASINLNGCDFLSVNTFDNNFLLASNLKDIIKIFDLRFIKDESFTGYTQPFSSVLFNETEIKDLQWFPERKFTISISTKNGIFIVDATNDTYNESKFSCSGGNLQRYIYWNEDLLTNFKPVFLCEDFKDTFCWINSQSIIQKYSLVYASHDAAYQLSNINININSFPSYQNVPLLSNVCNNEIESRSDCKIPDTPVLFGYSWIPRRISNYYCDLNTKVENMTCNTVLWRLQEINSKEAQYLVENQKDPELLRRIGIFLDSNHINNIIRVVKSVSHTYNYLYFLPKRILHWEELMKQIINMKNDSAEFGNSYNLEIFALPNIKDLFVVLKNLLEKVDKSFKLSFRNFNLGCDGTVPNMKNVNVQFVKIFSSQLRERLILFFGGFSVNAEIQNLPHNVDPIIIETFLLGFFWNCITLQYQNFILHCDVISTILDLCLNNEYKLIKESFLNNLRLFLNSAGIFISNIYHRDENNTLLFDKDIQFYYHSIISTSEILLNEVLYQPIWNCNIHLESVLYISIGFIVSFSKYFSSNSNKSPFSIHLLEDLLIPSVESRSYIYIPCNLLLVIGLYYLPIDDLSTLIEFILREVVQNGYLDGISMLGMEYNMHENKVNDVLDHNNFEKTENTRVSDTILVYNSTTSIVQKSGTDKKMLETGSQDYLKLLINRYLSLSFGDIQTVALIGSCLFTFIDDYSTSQLIKTCIDEYTRLLKNSSFIDHILNGLLPLNAEKVVWEANKSNRRNIYDIVFELNILRFSYPELFHDIYRRNSGSAPTGNILFCYYCERPLFQTYFESKISNNGSLLGECVVSTPKKAEVRETQMEIREGQIKTIQNLDSEIGQNVYNKSSMGLYSLYQTENNANLDLSSLILNCPNKFCNRPLPRCVICLTEIPINANFSSKDNKKCEKNDLFLLSDNMENWYTWCLYCHHGGCFKHIIEWFECFDECPVPECNCWCNSVDCWYQT
ncbi:GATOR complex protein MIOS isoform X1 [Cryptosporidium felis]|nr:GATOR complex protein MIOS isoform X1 [Cryptosporidium felis]